MKSGKAFELFVKHLLINIGFSEISSDGLYIFDSPAGQMIQGLGEAHNADVLLEPPVQTPFLYPARLLIECKDYSEQKVPLNVVRSALGLREDINHFNIVDINVLNARRSHRFLSPISDHERFSYQVAVAATGGFTSHAQEFAAAHRIPLLEFDKMPFWGRFIDIVRSINRHCSEDEAQNRIISFAEEIGRKMAVAITNTGQMLFLYTYLFQEQPISLQEQISPHFESLYHLYWNSDKEPWQLISGEYTYLFQLPKRILDQWITNASTASELKANAITCKTHLMSNMVVYYVDEHCSPAIKMISIEKSTLKTKK